MSVIDNIIQFIDFNGTYNKAKKPPFGLTFLGKDNLYRDLAQYLMSDVDFLEYLTKDLKLLLTVFAYVDIYDKSNLRYLYGKQEKHEIKPHYYLPLHFKIEHKFIREDDENENSLAVKIMEYIFTARIEKEWDKLDFVKSLSTKKTFYTECKKTIFEKKHNVIYVPTGEITACCIQWLFYKINSQLKNTLTTFHEIKDNEIVINNLPEMYFDKEKKSLLDWYYTWGIINESKNDFTQRGKCFINWLNLYIRSFSETVEFLGEEEINYFKILNLKECEQEDFCFSNCNNSANSICAKKENSWLKKISPLEFMSSTFETKLIIVTNLFLEWSRLEKIVDFEKRIRWSVRTYFLQSMVNYKNRGNEEIENGNRAWIAFPVLKDKYLDKTEKVNVGFFLSAFDDSNNGLSFIENNADKLIDQINRIKLFAHLIGQVENNEVYFKSIQNFHILNQAVKAAISQVMTRNMSHNIGSHVLSKLLKDEQIRKIYFKNKDGEKVSNDNDIQSILTNDKVFYQCLNVLKDIDIKSSGDISIENKETNESLLATFFSYLKARMDFLADVTTSTPVMENTRSVYNDMVKPFIQNRVLNDRISGIDKFYYEIIACKPDCTNNNGKKCKDIITKDDCLCKLHDTTDIQISVPNDVLGIQAFYTILENIIRNTAKHVTTHQNGNFEFKIRIEETRQKFAAVQRILPKSNPNIGLDLDEYYTISVFDNCDLSEEEPIDIDKVSENDKDEIKKKQCYRKKISNGKIKKIDKLVIDQNHILNKSIIENNQLRYGGWGLIEMDASAAYLRKIPVELIDSDEYEIKDLYGKCPVSEGEKLCVYQAYAEQGKYLGYRFFVYKPREILIIANDDDLDLNGNDKEITKKELKKEGIWLKTKSEIKEATNKKDAFPHKLVILVGDQEGIEIENEPCFSKRWFNKTGRLELKREGIEQFKQELWIEYYKKAKINFYKDRVLQAFGFEKSLIIDKKADLANHGKEYCDKESNTENAFIEIKTSATSHFIIDALKSKPQTQNVIGLQQRASEPLKVLVLDERIQAFAYSNKYSIEANDECKKSKNDSCYHNQGGVPYETIYKNTNIKIPQSNECNLNAQSFYSSNNNQENENKKITQVFKTFIKENIAEPQFFLVIHLGIIEKLINAHNSLESLKYNKEDKESTRSFIETEILGDTYKKFYDNIVVTSGRGTPQNIPFNIRYLNFSVISQYMITLRNKYALTEALYSARKTN